MFVRITERGEEYLKWFYSDDNDESSDKDYNDAHVLLLVDRQNSGMLLLEALQDEINENDFFIEYDGRGGFSRLLEAGYLDIVEDHTEVWIKKNPKDIERNLRGQIRISNYTPSIRRRIDRWSGSSVD